MPANSKRLATIAAVFALGVLLETSAHAQTFQRTVQVCNQSREALNVAAGFDMAGTQESRFAGQASYGGQVELSLPSGRPLAGPVGRARPASVRSRLHT